jgi:CO dehydrogenase maturation factor
VVVVADMEAGLEHLSWAGGTLRHADLLLVVAAPEVKSLLTAARTIALARQLGIPRIGLVGNRGRDGDEELFRTFARQHEVELLAVVPVDEAIIQADRNGACVLDTAPSAPAVGAIQALAAVVSGSI